MKNILIRCFACLVAISMLGACVSCGQTNDDPVPTDTETAENNETGEVKAYDEIQKETFNRTFAILARDDSLNQFEVEDLTGALLDDMLYERNSVVEKDFEITFEYYAMDVNQVHDAMRLQVSSGLDEYDMYSGHKYSFATCAQNNYCYDLNSIVTLDLSKPQWDQGCYENLTIQDRTYIMTGDIDPNSMQISACFLFNKSMMTDLGLSVQELNNLAANGGWTLDVMYEYGKDVTFDLNGDGKISHENDRFNFSGWMMDVPYCLYYGAGGMCITIVDGTPELTLETEDLVNVYEKIYSVVVGQNAHYVTDVGIIDTFWQIFRDGRSMFLNTSIGGVKGITEGMEDGYGILPTPKYDTNQKEYLSFVNGASPFVMVAKTENDPEFVGTIMDAMAAYNYDNVSPLIFQVITKLQAAQDPESAAMVDVIIRHRIFDLAYFCDYGVANLVYSGLYSKRPEIASDLKGNARVTERMLEKLIESFDKHD